jgi:hypothetical protein
MLEPPLTRWRGLTVIRGDGSGPLLWYRLSPRTLCRHGRPPVINA